MKKNKTKEIFVPCKYIQENGAVLDFTGLYEVSNLGRVKSLNYLGTGKAKIMSPGTLKGNDRDKTIYYKVKLTKGGKRYDLMVHRLVLSSFRPKGHRDGYFPGAVVDHIDPRTESYCNDCLDNLHWVTLQDNVSTDHCKTLNIERQRNRPDQSKRVKVTFPDGTQKIFPSAREADRDLCLPERTVAHLVRNIKGYYKKLNLHFEYVL